MTNIIMYIFLLVYIAIVLTGIKYQPNKENFFDAYDTYVLRGIFCVIVILVHIPVAYQNQIQDMLGSFAYIGVTFFFMTSSYGLKWGLVHKENYLHSFWRKRLPALLVPAILCNLVSVGIKIAVGDLVTFWTFININNWVKVLLLFYFVFWCVYFLSDKLNLAEGGYWQDILICLIVATFSLVDKLTPVKLTLIWPTESMGFVYGVVLANCFSTVKSWMKIRWVGKCVILFGISGLLGVAYLKWKDIVFWGDYCLKIALGIVMLLLLLQVTRNFKIGNRTLIFLGTISYEVYLLHHSVFDLLANISVINNSGVFVVSAVVLTVLIATFIKWCSGIIIKTAFAKKEFK